MDNVVQNIKIEDIVPRSHHQTNESFKELEDLAISIRENGIKEPLIVKKKDNRYEIISGNKRYRAAILAGISEVPVIVKNYNDDNLIKNIEENDNISFNSINNNSDIVNLSELNKEYERDDFNMNNELPNNNITQPTNNTGAAPTFGGRFFPSLEDQPTNMSFNAPIEPAAQPAPASNLIDLTDTSNVGVNNLNVAPAVNPTPQPEVIAPVQEVVTPSPGNVLNLESLTQNNEIVQPTPVVNVDNNFQNAINDFNPNASQNIVAPTPVQEPAPVVQPEAVAPVQEVVQSNIIQPEIASPIMNPTVNVPQDTVPTTPVQEPQPVVEIPQPISVEPTVVMPEIPTEQPLDLGIQPNIVPNPAPQPAPVVQPEIVASVQEVIQPVVEAPQSVVAEQPVQQKDVLPVINTLKAVGVSLESFGYTVRITDEDLPTSYKITIEVEK